MITKDSKAISDFIKKERKFFCQKLIITRTNAVLHPIHYLNNSLHSKYAFCFFIHKCSFQVVARKVLFKSRL